MAIQKKEIYEEFLAAFEWNVLWKEKYENVLYKQLDSISVGYLPKDKLREILLNVENYNSQFYEEVEKNEVSKWFNKQENYHKAKKSMWAKAKLVEWTAKELFEHRLAAVFEKQSIKKEAGDSFNLGRHIDYYFNPLYNYRIGMLLMILKPIYDYFYSDRAVKVHKAKVEFEKAIKKCRQSVGELFKYSDYEEFLDSGNVAAIHNFKSFTDKRFLMKISNLEFNSPVMRNDETIRERMLVYDLDKRFRKLFNSSKPNAIFYLMMIEGVEHNLEKRTIERMLEKWRNERRERSLAKRAEFERNKASRH